MTSVKNVVKFMLVRNLAAAAALCAAAAALFTCETVPEYCGKGTGPKSWLNEGQFCFGDAAHDFCGGAKFNPLTEGCDTITAQIGTRCLNGSVVPKGTPCGGYTIATNIVPAEGGNITRTPPDTANYKAGDSVTLTATPNSNFDFIGWVGAAETNNRAVTIKLGGPSAVKPLVAMFKPADEAGATAYRLITSAFPENGGTIARSPNSETYDAGDTVTVTAAEASGYTFSGWVGTDTSKNKSITLTMYESKTLVALFTQNKSAEYTLTVNVNPETGGAVFVGNSAVEGSAKIDAGTTIEVRAVAAAGYGFTGWTGGETSTEAVLTVSVSGDLALTASFKKKSGSSSYDYASSCGTRPCETVEMPDGKTWMAENLNIKTTDSWCYENSSDNCAKYGRLYTWKAANSVCPAGWILPDTADWNRLMKAAGGNSPGQFGAANNLKSTSGWNNNANGSDTYGFKALPSYSHSRGGFDVADWWTRNGSQSGSCCAMGQRIQDIGAVYLIEGLRSEGFSVRCIADGGTVTPPTDSIIPPPPPPTDSIIPPPPPPTDSIIPPPPPPPDGEYESVEIGGLKWMKKNLDIETADSWCYENSPDSCAKYGRLYTWSAAKSACQSVGWRLPDAADWRRLVDAAGGSSVAGKTLKSKTGWNSNSGTDTYGFSALPGGFRITGGYFYDVGNYGYWWTATEDGSGYAYYRYMNYYYDYVLELYFDVGFGLSARCVKDD